jgi:hypothetical protein
MIHKVSESDRKCMNKKKEALIMSYKINKHGYLLKCNKVCVYVVNLKVNQCNYISCHTV